MATPMTTRGADAPASILRQPRSVWAVAFACVIAFMGIGLVDPILPAISAELGATPAETELLFTSYLLVTGLAMFFTSFVSSRIGAKPTLLVGLALIVVFAALAGASGSVNEVIGFRAGWGLGNALFISTALATIVGAASGGADRAIILYEAALGLGIAVGPLVGGALGSISWRGPFFGTAVLMAIGLLAIAVLLGPIPKPATRVPLSATFLALRHPALLTLGVAALFYNFGFFSLLAYTPFPLETAAKASGLHRVRRPRARTDLLRLGPLRRDHLGLRGAAAHGTLRPPVAPSTRCSCCSPSTSPRWRCSWTTSGCWSAARSAAGCSWV